MQFQFGVQWDKIRLLTRLAMEQKPLNSYENPVKIFIKDIHNLKRLSEDSNYYHFCGRPIRKVDIMGVVTEVRKRYDFHLYRVDDCTGEILCKHNHYNQKNLEEAQEIEFLQDLVADKNFQNPEVGAAMEYILEETFKVSRRKMTPLEQGDCVQIQGFVTNFFGAPEVIAFKLCKVNSLEHEVDRVFEMSKLYSTVYSKLKP